MPLGKLPGGCSPSRNSQDRNAIWVDWILDDEFIDHLHRRFERVNARGCVTSFIIFKPLQARAAFVQRTMDGQEEKREKLWMCGIAKNNILEVLQLAKIIVLGLFFAVTVEEHNKGIPDFLVCVEHGLE